MNPYAGYNQTPVSQSGGTYAAAAGYVQPNSAYVQPSAVVAYDGVDNTMAGWIQRCVTSVPMAVRNRARDVVRGYLEEMGRGGGVEGVKWGEMRVIERRVLVGEEGTTEGTTEGSGKSGVCGPSDSSGYEQEENTDNGGKKKKKKGKGKKEKGGARSPQSDSGYGFSVDRTGGVDTLGFRSDDTTLGKRASRFNGAGNAKKARYGDGFFLDDKYMGGSSINSGSSSKPLTAEDFSRMTVVGTCERLEKDFFRLTAPPKPEDVRPVKVLMQWLSELMKRSREGNAEYR